MKKNFSPLPLFHRGAEKVDIAVMALHIADCNTAVQLGCLCGQFSNGFDGHRGGLLGENHFSRPERGADVTRVLFGVNT